MLKMVLSGLAPVVLLDLAGEVINMKASGMDKRG